MSKKILIAVGVLLVIVGVVIFTRNATDQQNTMDQQAVKRSSYTYADGNGNIYNLDPVAMTIEYDPVILAESSSGMYSGGEYTKKTISVELYDTVAVLFGKASLNKSAHIENRIKGSGSATITDGTSTNEFILGQNTGEKAEIEKMLKVLVGNK